MTNEQRQDRWRAFDAAIAKVEAINGPWRQMKAAIAALEELQNATAEVPPAGICATCGDLVWSDDENAEHCDDAAICGACNCRYAEIESPDLVEARP